MHSNSGQVPPFSAIIVAAGKGLRAGQPIPKQFAGWNGKPVVRHSAEHFAAAGAAEIIVAIPEGADEVASSCLSGIASVRLITGGATRQESVRIALEALEETTPDTVLIHDAARPDLPQPVIEHLLAAMEEHEGAIPVLPVVDSMVRAENNRMAGDAKRDELRRVQTPQAFRYGSIMAAHRAWIGESTAGDDAQVLVAAGKEVALVVGDERLKKLTYAEDFMAPQAPFPALRMGTGFDVHRLAEGEELWLCGIKIDHDKGLAGHSDADVGLHAVVDAILGACAQGDIGDHFPPSDPQWKGAPSSRFVEHAVKVAADAGWAVSNVDLTLICEAPKIGPHREAMRTRLAELLGLETNQVNVKATTTEKLGFTGRGEGIAAQAAATLMASAP
ncbi:bifunctional 2-C-methyl-D-erythritol 4-phosphate cytidylyltransferase/2-C-methyl-D-erythritol 2,4-cyclodiphosphate synthase [Aurantiacibacter sp. D1-12]|uniref:bifunctional 2-C-methyl-D-erythritol 4-phosphate cytidylyltransferase/2-C-methyl-D-erythritol 2,4-cyclodiphosphate synthase n=1 Tax=Aurantiacibacter sp. D1-12 TaxID=2993658 RepID=UPI00237CCFE6|nr:bifunctional 2-C-methyl-D-erythritol 4-phosphate cytidylyltransferase/2-C-methyl-D-erythritol 2,4-cyclodiphosphate synthase [Aurantiacibacter sp. D1-12]MDE1466763.1 bifunctional 2-C-methyl-D-erythritol 4-phosphate cytidylyltransferase/2-C-methyl-D-erythritol 2,4-cyclodiphosphate synthase [Aurantiacibacter sp. D1-12]